MINEICSNPVGFAAILVGVPAVMGITIKMVYDKCVAWDAADKSSRKAKRNIVRRRNGQEPLA